MIPKIITKKEENPIRVLISTLRNSSTSGQKKIRRILRSKFGFYISEFDASSKGFTLSDFDECIQLKKIIIS
jgi:hypothetical protein